MGALYIHAAVRVVASTSFAPSPPPVVTMSFSTTPAIKTKRKAAYSTGLRGSASPSVSQVPDLTEEQRAEVREAFQLFDADKDGRIDYHELKVAMRALGFDLKKPEVLAILSANDPANEGNIGLEAFTRVMAEKIAARDPMEEVHRAFALFDADSRGKIGLRELRRVSKELGEQLDESELYVAHSSFRLT